MEAKNKSLDYTCIFGGGAIRGTSYVGAVKALEELGIEPKTMAGSSVGAIFAGLLAVGYTAQELKEIFMQVNFELFRDIHFGFGKDFAISKGNIFLDWLRELIEKKYYGDDFKKGENSPVTFRDLDKNLIIITTDLTNFKYKEFSKFEAPDFEVAYAIRISSSMPGLMKPVEYNDSLLVDGDLQKSWPMWKLSQNLCPDNGRVLEFRLEGDYEGKGQNAIDFINTVYSCVTSVATDYVIKQYGGHDNFDYVKINTGSVVVVDFNLSKEKRQELISLGYEQTKEYFLTTIVKKKQLILEPYKALLKKIKKLERYIVSNKVRQAQVELGMVFMDLCEMQSYMDVRLYSLICDFKANFLKNINIAGLFGIFTLSNSKLLKSQIKLISINLEEKILELESYIYKI